MNKIFWIVGNVYGKVMGWSFMASFHHAVINLCLHGLGYGNMYFKSSSGEEWFLKEVLKKTNPRVIVDVGANVGNYSQLLLTHTDAKIYAVEPNPSSFSRLETLPERVTKINCAVSNKKEESFLYFESEFDEQASLNQSARAGKKVSVQIKTMQDIVAEYNIENIDFLKIDTEGFEREVLEGLGDIRPKYIQFEFNIDHLQRDVTLLSIVNLLPEYTLYRLLPHGWIKFNPKKYLNNIFMYSNVVAVKAN